ncbi:MAG: MFS transporter [Nocardioides sp.]|uniref:MFS transporter n=1 Tax=Nocardioides sp. TaxID=35761 RepID=UPI0039E21765
MTEAPTAARRPTETSARHFAMAVFALAVGGFAIGTTEFVTMGVLPQVADGVGVRESTAGHLISAYALGVVVGVPVLSFMVARLPRRGLLIGLMATYALFNLLSAVATGYHMLAVARFLAGLPHGAYFGVASLVAAGLADPRHKGRAVATVMLGLSVANVVGVPAATWLGQNVGWRATYAASAGLALLTVLLVRAFVPATPGDPHTSGRGEARTFFTNPQVWLTMAAGAIGFGGMFAVYSYIAPLVTDVAGLADGTVPWFVLAFGAGMVVGTWFAGELARWSVFRSLLIGGGGMAVALLAYWLIAPHGWWLWPITFVMSAISSVLVVNLQLRLMDVAGDAVTLGAAMNHAALNVANAVGAFLGGLALDAWSARATTLVGATLSVAGLLVLLWSGVLHRRTPTPRPAR